MNRNEQNLEAVERERERESKYRCWNYLEELEHALKLSKI